MRPYCVESGSKHTTRVGKRLWWNRISPVSRRLVQPRDIRSWPADCPLKTCVNLQQSLSESTFRRKLIRADLRDNQGETENIVNRCLSGSGAGEVFHRQLSSYFSLDLATGFEENRETVCNHTTLTMKIQNTGNETRIRKQQGRRWRQNTGSERHYGWKSIKK